VWNAPRQSQTDNATQTKPHTDKTNRQTKQTADKTDTHDLSLPFSTVSRNSRIEPVPQAMLVFANSMLSLIARILEVLVFDQLRNTELRVRPCVSWLLLMTDGIAVRVCPLLSLLPAFSVHFCPPTHPCAARAVAVGALKKRPLVSYSSLAVIKLLFN
jgi:hypothetical protein